MKLGDLLYVKILNITVNSVASPDPAFQVNPDPDPAFQKFQVNPDPDPAFQVNPDPDPGF